MASIRPEARPGSRFRLLFEHGLSGKSLRTFPDHAWTNFLLAVAANAEVYTPSRLAGVLLGKTSLNSLYGEQGGLPQPVFQFRRRCFGASCGLRLRRTNKLIVFLEF